MIKQHDLGGDLMKIVFLDIDGVLNHACTKERFQSYIGIDESSEFCGIHKKSSR